MNKKLELYAQILLKNCLNIKKSQALFISAPIEVYEFTRILSNEAFKLGISEIYFDFEDDILKKDILKNCKESVILKNNFWNKKVWDEYAKKDAAFLMLRTVTPDILDDIDGELLSKINVSSLKTKKVFMEKQIADKIAWTIACVATEKWAKKLFPSEKKPLDKLWNTIFDMCLIKDEDSHKEVMKKINEIEKTADKLNKLKIKELHYKNKLGTDLKVELPQEHVWIGAKVQVKSRNVICNYPSEEIYTAPKKDGVNGIVYSTKPLLYNGKIIENFWLKFNKGKVVDFNAEKGKDILEKIITADKTANMLGEVALVPYDSAISKTNIVFYNTLYDENASCHLAFGKAYSSCIKNGDKKNRKELKKLGLNDSILHVDFMIGSKDLEIIGYTKDNKEYQIFKDGNFSI